MKAADVESFRAGLDADTRATVDALRAVVAGAHPGLSEHIKWNAPSFVLNGEDRITLGLQRQGGVRVVLHRGAKAKDGTGPAFDDPAGLARWPSPDRGVILFDDAAHVERRRDALTALCARWLAAEG